MASEVTPTEGADKSVIAQILEVITIIGPIVQAFIDAGKDAPTEIKRILSADPALAAMQAEWQSRLDGKFGPG
jgi:hypothetical protein